MPGAALGVPARKGAVRGGWGGAGAGPPREVRGRWRGRGSGPSGAEVAAVAD